MKVVRLMAGPPSRFFPSGFAVIAR